MSTLLMPGPRHEPREALPGVPTRVPTRVKAAGLSNWNGSPPSIVHGTPGTLFGRTFDWDVPVPAKPADWKLEMLPLATRGVIDEPELAVKIVANSQPPSVERTNPFEPLSSGK